MLNGKKILAVTLTEEEMNSFKERARIDGYGSGKLGNYVRSIIGYPEVAKKVK